MCRSLLRRILQTATGQSDLIDLNSISTVELRLSLDDELALLCWNEEGLLGLTSLEVDVINSVDGEWHQGWNLEEVK